MPQSGWISGESKCFARQTACSGESGRSLYSSSGKISLTSRLKPCVELGAAATGLGEDEAPLLDKVAEVLSGLGRKLGRLVAVEESDRGLEHVLDRGARSGRRPAR